MPRAMATTPTVIMVPMIIQLRLRLRRLISVLPPPGDVTTTMLHAWLPTDGQSPEL